MSKLDTILNTYLVPDKKVPPHIDEYILSGVYRKGKTDMKKVFNVKKLAMAAVMVLCCAIPTYAAIKFLTPAQVVEKTGNSVVSKAFETEDAIAVNETQSFENYNITLLGLVSGENLGETDVFVDGELQFDKTYCVIAVENADGSDITDIASLPSFCMSPFIKGYRPTVMNIMTLNGGFRDVLVDGVMYRVLKCDNIEPFAYDTVYLGVTEGMLPDYKAFSYDEATGEISRAEGYTGINALFELPLDVSKADSTKAQEIINSIMG